MELLEYPAEPERRHKSQPQAFQEEEYHASGFLDQDQKGQTELAEDSRHRVAKKPRQTQPNARLLSLGQEDMGEFPDKPQDLGVTLPPAAMRSFPAIYA